ncbi:MAG: hypothetical protein IKS15_03705 [Opitutales bacterium]|nr:hypothetical protein [Opitutales bacterium]
MKTAAADFFENKTALFADTTADTISVCITRGATPKVSLSAQGGALENLFRLISKALQEANISAGGLDAAGFCQGAGSILGVRAASAALAAFRAANPRMQIFVWDLFKVYAQMLSAKGEKDFALLCPSRKNFANLCKMKNGEFSANEIPVSDIPDITLPIFFINQRKLPDKNFENLPKIYFGAREIALFLTQNPRLAQACAEFEIADAATLAKREYAKWNSTAHS